MNDKKINEIITNRPESDYPGYYIYFEDYSTKYIKLDVEEDKQNGGKTYKFEDKQVIAEFVNENGEGVKLIFLRDRMRQLQSRFACPKCQKGWLEIIEQGEEEDGWTEKENEFGRSTTIKNFTWYKVYECVSCKQLMNYSGRV